MRSGCEVCQKARTEFLACTHPELIVCEEPMPEHFKTRAAHFPVQRDERTGMQRATLGKRDSEADPQLQGRIARAFFSNSLVNTMEMMAAIQ